MRHRIITQGSRAKSYGYSMRHVRSQSTFQQRISITVTPGTAPIHVIDQLGKYALESTGGASSQAKGKNGVAIFASREFSSWLETDIFMPAFLGRLFKPTGTAEADHLNVDVLSGVTDSILPYRASGAPNSGLSVLWGSSDRILPGLWEEESFGTDRDRAACVSFVTNPLSRGTGALEVTLPLANTVFQNGRRSTLHASSWNINSDGSVVQLRPSEPKMTQRIVAQGDSINHTTSRIPILPVTPPRKVIASLGNIVRQVEVDGATTPASKELEAIIPKIFEERAQLDPTYSPTPIGVWCWVIPPHVMGSISFDSLKLFKAGSCEVEIALGAMDLFNELLASGCRLHKILSGGGGWGVKQGLLSLDPETTYSLPGEDDDMEMFIESFKQRNSTDATGGLVTPGSSLLFCVEPQRRTAGGLSSQFLLPQNGFAFGVAPNQDDMPSPTSHSNSANIARFSVCSADGLFLRTIPGLAGTSSNNMDNGTLQSSFATKINAPGTYLSV